MISWIKQHKVITAVIAVVVIVLFGITGAPDTTTNLETSQQSIQAEPKEPEAAKTGSKVRDGKFEFVVSKLKCGEKQVGDEFVSEKAQGEFCRLSLKVSNISNEPQTLLSDDQKLIDEKGRSFSADSTATIYAATGDVANTWFEEVNPGNSVSGDILFDVPTTAKIVAAELHDSAFSGGVKVSLKK